jgi:tetratricopeptide (TPR) repeat protein
VRRFGGHILLGVTVGVALAFLWQRPVEGQPDDALWHHRNLGKAFYENPTTGALAVDEFKKALDLAPGSARERVNYGLALLRAGKTPAGIAELQAAQEQDPSIPHTWFNLGIAFKKESHYPQAIAQFEQMVKLVPDEAVSHYNLGYLYKLTGRSEDALREFELAAKLDPNLAGPHFQLFNSYKEAGRADAAAREQALFQEIRKRQAGAAVPEDLDWSYYAEIMDPIDPADAEDDGPAVDLKFAGTRLPAALAAESAGLLAFDADSDGRPDLLAWSADTIRLFRNGDTAVDNTGLEGIKGVRSIANGDYNNDGFRDLAILAETGVTLYAGSQGAYTRSPAALPNGNFAKALWFDYDHDYDLDLALVGDSFALLRNNGQAGFSDQTRDFPFVAGPGIDAVAFNFVSDTDGHDLLVTYANRAAVLYRDQLAGKYRAEPVEMLPAGARSLVARDLDNDGRIDIAAGGARGLIVLLNRVTRWAAAQFTSTAARTVAAGDLENRTFADLVVDGVVLRNQAVGRFAAPGAAASRGAVAVTAADFDSDGRVDIAAISADGSLHLLRNESATANGFARVALTGVKNPRLARGAIVEVKAGARYQKQMYAGAPLHFGMRDESLIDAVRITWPNGLIQNETKQPVRQTLAFKEAQRLSGSCPMIFTWNGRQFQFITDVLGVAPLGASAGDGTFFPVDHDEYIQIPGEALVPMDLQAARNGTDESDLRGATVHGWPSRGQPPSPAYEIRITEELREVAYLDRIQLVAVDHPTSVDVYTNDKFKAPPFPDFRLFGVRRDRRVYPVIARDGYGRDVRPALLAKDRAYPDGFTRDHAGVAELHTLDLDFGRAAPGNRAILVMNGWVDWADGSTFLGAAQEDPRGLIFPSVQVKDASGRWRTVIEDMGIPAGKPKTIVVDLTGRFLSDSREVRIVTNLCLYWDEIFLAETPEAPEVVLTRIDPAAAALRFRGFSTPTIHPERTQPESFDYQRPMPLSMWNQTPGFYTRYGDVRPLATEIDDRMIVMGSGDELRLLFPAAADPPQPGWRRDFLLFVDGWAKDGDANTAFSRTVDPLPFHGMSSYPYPAGERFPDTPSHRQYRDTYNTRPALRLLRPLTTSSSGPDVGRPRHRVPQQ